MMNPENDPMTLALETWDACHAHARRAGKLITGLVLVLCFLLCLLLASCTVGPVITATSVSLGGTVMTKSKGYYARYDGPLGKIETGTAETDETVIPGKVANYYGIKAATDGAVALLGQP